MLDYSADCEVLEIIVPADFKTEESLRLWRRMSVSIA